jgi:predicted nucleic acid-binding protein
VRLLLDSAFVIDFLRGQPAALGRYAAIFEDGDEAYVNDVVVCEVRTGLRGHHASLLQEMLEPIEFIAPGPEHALLAGAWRAEARGRGQTLSLADALIAAAAASVGAAVLTRNARDFALTPVRVLAY